MTEIHVYEYESMPGMRSGYYEIYEGEYHNGEFFIQADNSNVFELAKSLADSRQANMHFHTLAHYYAMSDLSDSMASSTTKEN